MKQTDYLAARREQLIEKMAPQSLMLLYSGIELHISADDYMPFAANRNFFYLTGLARENFALLIDKAAVTPKVTLFIERFDPLEERWYGRKVTVEEAKEISGIENIQFIDELDSVLDRVLTREDVDQVYFDTYRHRAEDLETYNLMQARVFASRYPGTPVRNAAPLIAAERMWKDEHEIELTREAIRITDQALQRVLKTLTPGMREYQAQAEFEYSIFYHGAESVAFPTIAGSGKNGTMLHYNTNREVCEDGSLILMDLGARFHGYNADITRTYPVNGKFTERQRRVYEIVLKANRAVAAKAKPGMTLTELNDICKEVLAEGCIELGLIEQKEELSKYYMHGVSHHLGIDVHDVTTDANRKLQPGAIITDEPGLYIDEWEIGIRIEDDLLITENGCEVLSEAILRDPDEIERFMAER